MMETQAATRRCLEPFRWESLCGWDFRPQLIVVSGLFGGNPFVDGILGHNLLLSRAFLVGIPSWMGFLATTYCCLGPFFTTLSFFRVEYRLSRSLSHELFSFFTMEFWLSRSLSHELYLFSRWNSGYHEAFLTTFFFFHDGILAITKPFSRTFPFFHDAILAITKPFSRTFSFFTMEFWLSRSLSHELYLFS
jgi:hypothetical protein